MESQSPPALKARCGVPNQDGTAWCLGPLRCAADSLGTMPRCRGIYKATIDGTVEFLGGIEDFTKHGHGGTWLKYGVNGINWRDTMIQPRDIGVVNQQKGWFQQLETVKKRGIPNQDVIPRTGQAMGPFFFGVARLASPASCWFSPRPLICWAPRGAMLCMYSCQPGDMCLYKRRGSMLRHLCIRVLLHVWLQVTQHM